MPGITRACGAVLAEAASVCLEDQGHGMLTSLTVDGDFLEVFALQRTTVDEQMRRSHYDEHKATENGACGVSILAACKLTNRTVLQQSRRGTGFDYWLGLEGAPFFQEAIRLEVSGIRRGGTREIRDRVLTKTLQVGRAKGSTPALITVVEFSGPRMRLVRR